MTKEKTVHRNDLEIMMHAVTDLVQACMDVEEDLRYALVFPEAKVAAQWSLTRLSAALAPFDNPTWPRSRARRTAAEQREKEEHENAGRRDKDTREAPHALLFEHTGHHLQVSDYHNRLPQLECLDCNVSLMEIRVPWKETA